MKDNKDQVTTSYSAQLGLTKSLKTRSGMVLLPWVGSLFKNCNNT